MRRVLRWVWASALTLGLTAQAAVPVRSARRPMMGTEVAVSIVGVSQRRAQVGFEAAFAVFSRVSEAMNEWRPDSPLSALNRAAGSGEWTLLPADVCGVLESSLSAARATGGLFDPTWAALRGLWKFGTEQSEKLPDAEALKKACALIDYQSLTLQPSSSGDGSCSARLEHPGMQVGLGGVAKGWGVDKAVAELRRLGFRNFFVQAGGDLYAAGRKSGRPWKVGIRDPRGEPGTFFASVELSDAAFSTSGDYERYFEVEGRRYHHLIDPRTCYPAQASRSVTVLARTALDAEFLTKAVFIRGGEEGRALAEAQGAQAVIVTSDNQVLVSKDLGRKLELGKPTP